MSAEQERLVPWFMCSECSEYAPVTELRVEDEDWLTGDALAYVHRDHGESCDAWDDEGEPQ